MTYVLLEKHWRNSRGEIDGWSFVVTGGIVHWSYDALFDASLDERSRGSADFDLELFERCLEKFRHEGNATMSGHDGAFLGLRRVDDKAIAIDIRPSTSVGCSSLLSMSELERVLVQKITGT